jgi:hypothetical protein
MDFINDAIVSMDAFVSAYKPAAVYFSCSVELRYPFFSPKCVKGVFTIKTMVYVWGWFADINDNSYTFFFYVSSFFLH